jgi:hypothetical protein
MDPIQLQEYYRRFGTSLVDLDEQENSARTEYQRALNLIRRNRSRDSKSLAAGAADRGMTHSGINLQSNLDLAEGYDNLTGQTAGNFTSTLSQIAKKRLDANSKTNEMRAIYG